MNQIDPQANQLNYTRWFNENIGVGIRQALIFSIRNPRMALAMLGLLVRFYFANRKRQKWAEKGIQVVKEKAQEGIEAIKEFLEKKKEEYAKKPPQGYSEGDVKD